MMKSRATPKGVALNVLTKYISEYTIDKISKADKKVSLV